MLYVVECAYTDPQSEAAWNTFYNQEKLPALVSVPGFYASRRNGGGHFARWQSAITDWHRHLYVADSGVREVRSDEVLLLSDTPQTLPISPAIVLLPGGLATQQTWYAAIVPRDDLHHLATAAAVFIYQPITARLRNPAQRA